MKETKERENKGITLVALVITIIVLLILAGVGIGAIAGPDGLIAKAKQSAEQYNQSAINEAETINDLLNILGDDKEPIIKGITAPDINKNPSAYYGKEVIYTPQNGATVGWKIFYADDENIYLIAADYVENQYAPNTANGTEPNKNGIYNIYFKNILNSYIGTIDIKGNGTIEYPGEKEIVKKWISHINSFISTYNNMKATAYLLDTNIWNNFKDINNKTEYIIGAPTLELFVASYNDIHSEKTLNCQSATQVGDEIKWSTDTTYNYYITGLNTEENLYVLKKNTDVSGYWLASPAKNAITSMFCVYYDGKMNNDENNNLPLGLRPIICLKSEVQLIEQEDGKYVIQ